MAEVSLKQVYKRYDSGVTAVRDVNLEINDGEFMVLVGPSGCGKSTTLRMVAGLEDISEGEVRIGGRVVNDLSPRDRDVAMVFQSYALYPHMTVRDNISFGLRLRKMEASEIVHRVDEAADILGLQDYLDRKPKQLSGGQRQRVAMGRAMVRRPSVFLFDEPLSNLDAKLRVAMRTELARLHRRFKTTTVYVTHDQVEAMTLATRIVVMNAGVVQQVGTPMELYRQPANRFVAGFIGSPSMNFFDVTIENNQIQGKGFSLPLSDRMRTQLNGHSHAASLTLGVRPEHLYEASDPSEAAESIPVQIDVIEPLGAEVVILGDAEGQSITAALSPETRVQAGDRVRVGVELDKMHLFERDSGAALS